MDYGAFTWNTKPAKKVFLFFANVALGKLQDLCSLVDLSKICLLRKLILFHLWIPKSFPAKIFQITGN